MMKRIAILGSTGSIGTSALKVISALQDRCQVVGLCAGANTDLLTAQAQQFRPAWVFAQKSESLSASALPEGTRILASREELVDAVAADDVDMVLCAVVGTAGLRPVLSAIRAGKDIALASKEILVMAGAIVTEEARRSGSRILPVDSEHCAIFQCLEGAPDKSLQRVILTCSGGPFHAHPEQDLSRVTLAETLMHPTWNMGKKITIDCATLMNKGLEMIEASWLFGVDESRIDVVIHPQSIVHSMVEFCDGSVLAQMGVPDMCLPIHYCINYPERIPSQVTRLDFSRMLTLQFLPPDTARFPALDLARQALRTGGAAGAVFNASNEVAVDAFRKGNLRFDLIPEVVRQTLDACGAIPVRSLEDILEADAQARRIAEAHCARCVK